VKKFNQDLYYSIKSTKDWIDILDDPEYDYNQINHAVSNYTPGNKTFWKVAEIQGDWQFDQSQLSTAKVQSTDMYSQGTFGSEKSVLDKHRFQFGYNRHSLDSISAKIVDLLELENITADVNLQPPGGVKCLHYDSLCSLYSDKTIDYSAIEFDLDLRIPKGMPPMYRLLVALTDWQPGWMFQLELDQWTGWKKGDVIAIDWRNAAHSTANGSFVDRPLLKITASSQNNWIQDCIESGNVRKFII
jgi:hypothetical protein